MTTKKKPRPIQISRIAGTLKGGLLKQRTIQVSITCEEGRLLWLTKRFGGFDRAFAVLLRRACPPSKARKYLGFKEAGKSRRFYGDINRRIEEFHASINKEITAFEDQLSKEQESAEHEFEDLI